MCLDNVNFEWVHAGNIVICHAYNSFEYFLLIYVCGLALGTNVTSIFYIWKSLYTCRTYNLHIFMYIYYQSIYLSTHQHQLR